MDYISALKTTPEPHRQSAIEQKIQDTYHEIMDSDLICDEVAVTNATGFGVDEYEILDVQFVGDECIVEISFSASGEQDEDKMFFGDSLSGNAIAIIDRNGNVAYEDITVSEGPREFI